MSDASDEILPFDAGEDAVRSPPPSPPETQPPTAVGNAPAAASPPPAEEDAGLLGGLFRLALPTRLVPPQLTRAVSSLLPSTPSAPAVDEDVGESGGAAPVPLPPTGRNAADEACGASSVADKDATGGAGGAVGSGISEHHTSTGSAAAGDGPPGGDWNTPTQHALMRMSRRGHSADTLASLEELAEFAELTLLEIEAEDAHYRKRLVRNRWQLALMLHLNPALRPYRAHALADTAEARRELEELVREKASRCWQSMCTRKPMPKGEEGEGSRSDETPATARGLRHMMRFDWAAQRPMSRSSSVGTKIGNSSRGSMARGSAASTGTLPAAGVSASHIELDESVPSAPPVIIPPTGPGGVRRHRSAGDQVASTKSGRGSSGLDLADIWGLQDLRPADNTLPPGALGSAAAAREPAGAGAPPEEDQGR